MKSLTVCMFMRASLFLGAVLAAAILAFDFEMYRDSQLRVSINYVSAQEALPDFSATTTLSVASVSVWHSTQEIAQNPAEEAAPAIAAPTTLAAKAGTIAPKKAPAPRAEIPVRLIIPSIGLDTSIDQMGLNNNGEMDVPDGSSTHVGWYKGGPRPGQMGSAVVDAHVFAAFKDLRHLKVGADVFVETEGGQKLRFVVDESLVFELADLKPSMLFGRDDARRLNLITCAGSPVRDTYSHRLVVYTKLVEVM